MLKHFNETFKENSKLRLEREYLACAPVAPQEIKVNEHLLTTEAIDEMLFNCERKLIALNQQVIKRKPQAFDSSHQNKILLVKQKELPSSDRLKSAIKRYRYQAQLHPDSAIVQTNLGKLYHKNQQLQEAICCYEKAIAIDGNYAPARKYLAQIVNK